VNRRLLLLAGATGLLWALTALPVWLLGGGGDRTLIHSGTALLLCLLPALLTLAWADWTSSRDPQQIVLVVLGGTGVRMFVVLLAGLLLVLLVPLFREGGWFLVWLLVFYLTTLTLEMTLLLKGRSGTGGSV
jgi:hypothetical protein